MPIWNDKVETRYFSLEDVAGILSRTNRPIKY
jgi:hypothetical protein